MKSAPSYGTSLYAAHCCARKSCGSGHACMLHSLYRTDSPLHPCGWLQRLNWIATPPSHVREQVENSDHPVQPNEFLLLVLLLCISSSSNSFASSWNGAELDDDLVLETSLLLLFVFIKVKSTPCGRIKKVYFLAFE